jgi:hypothetical protein
VTLTFWHLEVTGPEEGERLDRDSWQDGDGVIADRGYPQPETILRLSAQAVLVMIRLNPWAMPLYRCAGEPLDLVEHWQGVSGEYDCLPVGWGKPGRACEGWGHAYRRAPAQAEAARRRCRQNAQGRTPSQRTRCLAGGVWVFTTVPPEVIGTETVIALYRVRGQEELAIKRLKSVLDLDLWRVNQGSPRAEVGLYGKAYCMRWSSTHVPAGTWARTGVGWRGSARRRGGGGGPSPGTKWLRDHRGLSLAPGPLAGLFRGAAGTPPPTSDASLA